MRLLDSEQDCYDNDSSASAGIGSLIYNEGGSYVTDHYTYIWDWSVSWVRGSGD